MRDLFFYGTLRHVPLLEIVLDRAAYSLRLTPALLHGYTVSAVAQGPFPTIALEAGAQAKGLLVQGLTETDIERLDYYEGSFAYDLVEVTLAGGQSAEVYLPQPGLWTPQEPWSLRKWESNWSAMSCHAAREVMGYIGLKSREEVAKIFPRIRARAASKVRAGQSLHGVGTLDGQTEIIARKPAYTNFFALDDLTMRHEKFDGTRSGDVERAVFMGNDAAIVLPYDPVRDRVLLVEQIRIGPLARADRAVWQLEPIAGLVDVGETPREAALREAREEAGLVVRDLEPVAEVYASPGNSTEFHYIFLGLAELPDDITGIAGLDSEDEDIRSHVMSFDALMELIEEFGAANAQLVLAALWLARHRDRLRSS